MNDVLHALAISAGILLPVVVLIIVISMAVVKRGEALNAHVEHAVPGVTLHTTEGAAAAPAKAAKPVAAAASDEISVSQILLIGVGLFGLTILALLLLSIVAHLN